MADTVPDTTNTSVFGNIAAPVQNNPYFSLGQGKGLFLLLSNLFKIIGIIGGIYMVIQFITAGYSYISANGDPKKIEAAWTKIWQSMVGLVIIASAFVLAAVVGRLTGIDILNPKIVGPNG